MQANNVTHPFDRNPAAAVSISSIDQSIAWFMKYTMPHYMVQNPNKAMHMPSKDSLPCLHV